MRVAIVCVLVLMALCLTPAVAQEPAQMTEWAGTPGLDETAPAPLQPEATAAVSAPVVSTPAGPVVIQIEAPAGPSAADESYAGIVNRLVDLIIAVVAAGGGYAMVRAWRSPDQAKQFVNFGLSVLEFGAKLTPSTADDAAVKRLRDEWNRMISEAVQTAIKAQVAAEREKIRALTAQRAAEWKAAPLSDSDQSVPPVPPGAKG